MPSVASRFLYAAVSAADHARVKRIAAYEKVTVSAFLRAALNDYLEESGYATLADMRLRGEKIRRKDLEAL